MRIVGVGHSCFDYICSIREYPKEDGSTRITAITYQGGGAVATALVAASRLGYASAYIGVAGFDSVTDSIVSLFAADGVSTEYLERLESVNGLQSFVMVDQRTGSRTKFPELDQTPPIVWNQRLKAAVEAADLIHLDGTHYENALAAAKLAKEVQTTISLDGCTVQPEQEKNRALASLADILIMNSRYPLIVSGKATHQEALLEIAQWGPEIVMCTLGSDGVLAVIDGEVVPFKSYTVDVVDTTGAGDVFHGAFMVGYLDRMELAENIRFASAVAALKCTKQGGREGIPSKEAAFTLMREQV